MQIIKVRNASRQDEFLLELGWPLLYSCIVVPHGNLFMGSVLTYVRTPLLCQLCTEKNTIRTVQFICKINNVLWSFFMIYLVFYLLSEN